MAKGHVIKYRVLGSITTLVLLVGCLIHPASAHATETLTAVPKISEIYPNAPNSNELGHEFIELVNLSNTDIDLSRYALQIKDKPNKIMQLSGTLPASSYKSIITTFSLVNSGEVVQLVQNNNLEIIEEVSYSRGAGEDQSWSYFVEGWELTPITKDAPNQRYQDSNPIIDVCLATPELDAIVPAGYQLDGSGNCVPIAATGSQSCSIEISEISAQPNFENQEYIEFKNNGTTEATLKLCKIRINNGSERVLPDVTLDTDQLYVWSFSSGTIKNSTGAITLITSDNQERQYSYQSTNTGQVINFENGSLSGAVSDKPTPGMPNEDIFYTEEEAVLKSNVSLEPCAAGKYRNPETNRCKNIESEENNLAPCAADQVRNPETNRCRKITTASAALTPCKEGQERNPETNRCRSLASSTGSLKPCDPGQERNPETNRCRKIAKHASGTGLQAADQTTADSPFKCKIPILGFLGFSLAGYAAYEYRTDIRNHIQKIRERKMHGRPPS